MARGVCRCLKRRIFSATPGAAEQTNRSDAKQNKGQRLGDGGRGQPPTYQAGGKVVFSDGKPMNLGHVEFRPVDSEHLVVARAAIQSDGTFQLSTFEQGDGAIEGEHEVLARSMFVVGSTPPPGMPVFKPDAIDEKFTQYSTSAIRFTVTQDPTQNKFKIVVEHP